MINQVTTSLVLCAATCLSANAADSLVERIAPDNAVVVARVGNLEQCISRCKETSLWRLWKSDEMQNAIMPEGGQTFDEWIEEMADEIDVEPDAFVAPTGEVGFVLFTVPDEDMGIPQPSFVMYADWGAGADKNNTLIEAILAHGEESDEWDWDQEEIDGRKVHIIEFAVPEIDEEMAFNDMPGGPQQMLQDFGKIFITRVDNSFLVASHRSSMEHSLGTIGDADETGITGNRDYTHLSGMVGQNDASVVLLFDYALDLLAGADEMGMVMMFKPLLVAAFGEINGSALTVNLDAEGAMARMGMAIGMPRGASGLPGLMDSEAPRETLPRFVGVDSISYSRLNFEFDGFADFITSFIRSNPFLQMQMGEMLPMIDTEVREVCATLAPEVHLVGTLSRPITAESLQSYYAVKCLKPEVFEDKLAQLAPQMGMEPRDFQGNRLYSMQTDGMMPGMGGAEMAVGIGGGYVFAGQSQGVEAALRAVTNSNASGLAVDETYDRAIGLLDGKPVMGWGYTNTVDVMEAQQKSQQMMRAAILVEMKEAYPEFADEMQAEFDATEADMMDFDLLRRYLGPIVWQMDSTEEGFLGQMFILESDQQN